MMKNALPTLNLMLSMLIFGTIGIFARYIDVPSGFLALLRGLIGTAFILVFVFVSGKMLRFSDIKKNLLLLVLSGAAIGINWIFLFEAYRYTTIATATLCYYMAPVFLIIVAPFLLKERITPKKAVCVFVSILGMLFVSGVLDEGLPSGDEALGIVFGLLAAAFYTSVVIMNKKLGEISPYDKTVTQLFFASLAVLPYVLLCETVSAEMFNHTSTLMIVLLGIVHTGVAYTLYFASLSGVSAASVSVYSYIDPILAVLLSALLLSEPMTAFGIIGAVLILSSTLISSIDFSHFRFGGKNHSKK